MNWSVPVRLARVHSITNGPSAGAAVGAVVGAVVGVGATVATVGAGVGEGRTAAGVGDTANDGEGDGPGVAVGATACWQPITRPAVRMVAIARVAQSPVAVLMHT